MNLINVSPTIILSHPQMGENIGMTARAMANGGLEDLRLVNPRESWPSSKAYETAAGADWILDKANLYCNTAQAVGDMHLVFALSARNRSQQYQSCDLVHAIRLSYNALAEGKNVAFLLGCERSGLNNDEFASAHYAIKIPTSEYFSSLNLSQAVMLIAYEWCIKSIDHLPSSQNITNQDALPASMEEIDFFVQKLDKALDEQGFYKSRGMIPIVRRNIQSFFKRAQPMRYEVRTLHGMLRSLIGKNKKSGLKK